MLGEDHPDTLSSACHLAEALCGVGEQERARQLNEDTFARFRRVLGEHHPWTLASAGSLAVDLRALGEYEQARQLNEDTLVRTRRVLGEDHPWLSLGGFASDLRALVITSRPGSVED
jgi:hypothetical protein